MASTGKGITISGLEDCTRMFDQAPENLLKVSKTAARTAGREAAKHIKKGVPARWKKLTKAKVVSTPNGSLNVGIGLYNGHQQSGHQNKKSKIDDWFKAYWANYGTLQHRDPTHKFQRPVKHNKTAASRRRRNKGGQMHQNFFEGSIVGFEKVFIEAFQKSLKDQEDKLYKR